MTVTTTRTLAELEAECDKLGIDHTGIQHRGELFDLLRDKLGTFDPAMEIDPMKAKDLKAKIDWSAQGDARFAGIAEYMTSDWIMEPKFDGCRMRLFLGATGNSLNSGRKSVKTFSYTNRSDNFPHMRDAVIEELNGTVLDGELLAPSANITTQSGITTNSLLNASVAMVNVNPADSVLMQEREGKPTFWVFDILALQGTDMKAQPYSLRRAALELVVIRLNQEHPDCNIELVHQYESKPETVTYFLEQGYEGAMIKKVSAPYQSNKRSAFWLKVKVFASADVYVTGWNPGEGKNTGMVGSVKCSLQGVDQEFEVADVGNFTDDMRANISNPDGSLKQECYGMVLEIMAQGITKNGRLRHPHMIRIRPDKTAAECDLSQLEAFTPC